MAATGPDVKALQLQISASTELLIRNLKSADAAVADFRRQTDTQLDKIDGRFHQLGENIGTRLRSAIGGAAAIIGGISLVSLARQGLDYASSLGEVSQQIGVTARDLQVFRAIATQVGISQDEMDQGLRKLTLTIGQAGDGSKKQASAFNDLGINVRNAGGELRTASDIIPELADALVKIEDPAARARIEVELFGKTGQKLDTLLAGGSAAINNLADAAERAGLVLSDDFIQRADDAADKMSALKTVLEAKIAGVVAENADSISYLTDKLIDFAGWAGKGAQAWRVFILGQKAGMAEQAADGWFVSSEDRLRYLGVASDARTQINDIVNPKAAVRSGRSAGSIFDSQANPLDVGGALGSIVGARPMAGLNRIAPSGGGGKARTPKLAKPKQTFDEYVAGLSKEGLTTDVGQYSPKLTAEVSDALAAVDEVREKAQATALEFFRQGEERARSIGDTLYDALSGRAGSFWDQFQEFGLRAVTQIAGKLLTNNGGQGGGLGGIITSTLGSFLGGSFAGGGNPPVGKISLVGERGPELFVPQASGTIIPNGGFGGGVVQHFDMRGAVVYEDLMNKVAATGQQAAAVGMYGGRAAVADDFRRGSRPSLPGGLG
jgi:hypothetical protein